MASASLSGLEKKTLDDRDTTTTGPSGAGTTLALTVLYHPDLARIGDRALLPDLFAAGHAPISRTEPAFAPPSGGTGEPLGDEHLSRKPLMLRLSEGGGIRLDPGESSTAVSFRGQRARGELAFSPAQVARGVVLQLGPRVVVLLHPVAAHATLLGAEGPPGGAREIAGESDGIRRVLWEIASVADLELPLLLRGESGSGKELVARAVHHASPRRERPFVAVNLGAISPSLAVAEMFGAERGAYTGSIRRQVGYFEQARGGTLFLDEIGEAPVELQVALLRVLETGEMQTVGSQEIRKADVRIVAATDADLEAKVAAGTFRAPLLNRLSSYEVWIPPLRERRDDIGRLLARFLREELAEIGEERLLASPPGGKPWLPASAVARLCDYEWPGNVRQLRNVVRQLVVGNRGKERAEVTPAVERLLSRSQGASSAPPAEAGPGAGGEPLGEPLPPPPAVPSMPVPRTEAPSAPPEAALPPERAAARRRPADVMEAELAEALRASRFDLAAAAQKLGVSRASMYLLIERYPRFRTAGDLTPEEIASCHKECGGDVARMAERLEVSERALLRRVRELKLE